MERHEAPGQQQKIFEIQSPEKVLKKFARRWQLVSVMESTQLKPRTFNLPCLRRLGAAQCTHCGRDCDTLTSTSKGHDATIVCTVDAVSESVHPCVA
jgi:hypothetical protein